MAVLDPVKLVITNYPDGQEEWLDAENNPEEEVMTYRKKYRFSKNYILKEKIFKKKHTKNFFSLTLGTEVRLKNAYIIKGESVVKTKKWKYYRNSRYL